MLLEGRDLMETMVEIRGLKKTFPSTNGAPIQAVKGIDLDIYKGEIFSLLGPNGAGKTTTLSMISGLIKPTEGDAVIGGYSITNSPLKAKKLLGVIPQEVALYPALSARQNLVFFGKMYDLSGKELSRRVDEIIEFIDLKERQDEKIETYSGGMKRRVNIGVGLIHQPELLYMDEPTVGIDPQNRRRILDTVKQLRDEFGITVVYTTHLMEEAQELSDRVGIIDYGEIIALGTQGDLIQMVGEEDRLILNVGEQQIPDGFLQKIEKQIEGVSQVSFDPPGEGGDDPLNESGLIVINAKRGRKALPNLIQLAYQDELDIQSVEVREPDLEAVFLKLTGRELRE
jgi:ABC-2 type transport system ATP-binding protein